MGLYQKLRDLQFVGPCENFILYKEAIQDIPVNRIDSIRGKMIVEDLKRSWPYVLNMSGRNAVRGYHSIQNPSFEERKAIELYSGKGKVGECDATGFSYL